MNDFMVIADGLLSGLSDTSVFTPEILVRLIVFMLCLELIGDIFGVVGKALKSAGGGK